MSKSVYFLDSLDDLLNHPCLHQLETTLNLTHTCGYITMLKSGAPPKKTRPLKQGLAASKTPKSPTAAEKAKQSEISDFLEDLKELGIGDGKEEKAGVYMNVCVYVHSYNLCERSVLLA